MGLGSKLFRAGIASKIGAGPLAVQNRELDFLREELNNIAIATRQQAQQTLANQGALERTRLTAAQSNTNNLRTTLASIRNSQAGIAATSDRHLTDLRADVAGGGIGGNLAAAHMQPTELVETIALQAQALEASTSQKESDALMADLIETSVKIQESTGVPFDIRMALVPGGEGQAYFEEFTARVALEQERQELMGKTLGPGLGSSIVNLIAELGPDLAKTFVAENLMTDEMKPRIREDAFLALALAEVREVEAGEVGGIALVHAQIDVIVDVMAPGGIPTNFLGAVLPESKQLLAEIRDQINAQLADNSQLSRKLKEQFGLTIADVLPMGVVSQDDIRESIARIAEKNLGSQAEVFVAREQQLVLDSEARAKVLSDGLFKNFSLIEDPMQGIQFVLAILSQARLDMQKLPQDRPPNLPSKMTLQDIELAEQNIFRQIAEVVPDFEAIIQEILGAGR